MDWKPISTAPYTGDLELAVIEKDGPHTVGFPCHRVVGGWIAAETSGSLAKFAAMRRASSRVSRWVAERRCDAPMCPQVGDKRKSLALARNDVNDPQQKSELVPDLGNRAFNFRQLLRGCQPTIAAHRA
jgi:hypothetical protein